MIWNIIGITWMVVVGWATVLTLLSKKLSWLEKIVICSAIIFSFYMAVFVDDYEGIFTNPVSEYV
jgi:hypothetical protein